MPSATASASIADQARVARIIPFIVGAALFMQMLDSTVVATALPAMARSLNTTAVRLNVAITAYLMATAIFVPISGWAADRFGARRVFVSAIAVFSLSSVACALSQDLGQLVISRIAQGVGGAMMVPVGRLILLRVVPKHDLLKAMSFLSIPALLGPVIGPPLGGFLVTYTSWHWIFLINVPIGILGVVVIQRIIPEIREEAPPRLDWIGFLLSSICLGALVSSFETIGRSSAPVGVQLGIVAAGLVAGWLYWLHSRRIDYPIIDLSLMRVPTFAISVLGGNLCRFAVGAMPFLLAMLLQIGFGKTPFAAGLITFASAAGSMLMKFVAAPIIRTLGFRRVLTVNAVLTGTFVMVCALFTPQTSVWVMIVVLLIGGFFRSLQFTGLNTLTYADLQPQNMSRASSFAAMAQQLGVSLGVGVAAVTLNLSTSVRGEATVQTPDIVVGFLVIGLLCCGSILSFIRLPKDAGERLNTNKT